MHTISTVYRHEKADILWETSERLRNGPWENFVNYVDRYTQACIEKVINVEETIGLVMMDRWHR